VNEEPGEDREARSASRPSPIPLAPAVAPGYPGSPAAQPPTTFGVPSNYEPQDPWTDPRVTSADWRLPVPQGRLAYPPVEYWQDQRERVPPFELDETEITIARLRAYVEWSEGRPPSPGTGSAKGIQDSGWRQEWDPFVSIDPLQEQLRLSLTDRCDLYDGLGDQIRYEDESKRPANCISWYTAQAVCISEGGRLPTAAEWTFAAEGGPEGRVYPWGDEAPTQEHVAMDCLGDGELGCSADDLLDVGSRPLGAGRWGHLDLAGSLEEWMVDTPGHADASHWVRSSGFELSGEYLKVRSELWGRGSLSTDWYLGARCLAEE
jgi:formylglycine-generating enzyme required for sulfatase activity